MKNAFRLARKEARDIARERTILVAVVVQAVVAATSAFLAVGLLGLYDPGSIDTFPDAQVAYVGPGDFASYMHGAPNLRVRSFEGGAAIDRFAAGDVDLVVEETVPPGNGTRTVALLAPEGEIRTTLLLTQVRALLEDYEDDLRAERQDRIDHTIIRLEAPAGEGGLGYAFLLTTLLPLLVLTPVFLSGAVAADSLVQEMQQRTLALLRSAPLTTAELLLGKLLTPVLLAPLQVLLWIALLRLNGVPLAGTWLLAGFSTLLALLVCGLGMLAAVLVRREGQTQATYALVAILLGGLSVWLPRDPLNVIALTASGGLDAAAWYSMGWIAVMALAAVTTAVVVAARRMRTDRI